ncbi:alpha-1,2-glucosyltransferase Alg10 [Tachypleus tridentatus]|uniref:alpha-1,2-glucosyltransferase Alg10 n=1 Tax=Tachypleus tridentatus TaxID=6853 RepID=UPI003FD465D6
MMRWREKEQVFMFTFIFVIFAVFTIILFNIIYRTQPTPYMDEIFHIPQTQSYCKGNFTKWDPKITTPPGLYLSTVGVLVPLTQWFGWEVCEVYFLRLTNVFFVFGNFYLLYCLLLNLHPQISESKLLLSCLNLSIFPLTYFFVFLYYTDVGNLFFFLLMYTFHLQGQDLLAALFGVMAVFFRQTSIIWVFFMAAESSVYITMKRIKLEKKCNSLQFLKKFISTAASLPVHHKKQFVNLLIDILDTCGGYLLTAVGFIVFLYRNKGIALGDRDAHVLSFNVPQVCYFLGFVLVFCSPFLLSLGKVKKFISLCIKEWVLTAAVAAVMVLVLEYLVQIHPYLLADNRHLTFYVWRRFLGRNSLLSCAFIPAYIFSGWTILQTLQHKDSVWQVLCVICLFLSVVPQKLLEFRYFIIPYILLRLNIQVNSYIQLFLEFLIYVFVNAFTLVLFLNKPFYWEGQSEIQRIMW